MFNPRGSAKRKKKLMLQAVLVIMILGTLAWIVDVIRVINVSKKVTGSTIPGLMVRYIHYISGLILRLDPPVLPCFPCNVHLNWTFLLDAEEGKEEKKIG